jgi:uroporphyrin-III C-methyltransferase
LIAAGKPASTPVVVVVNASLPDARRIYTTLAALPSLALADVEGPALILVGEQFRAHAITRETLGDVSAAPRSRSVNE